MRETTPPEDAPRPIVPYDEDRYAAIGTTDREVVIWDREEDSAWVKSDGAVPLEGSR